MVPIALSAISMLFMIGIARKLERRRTLTPYLAALLFAVLPWIVIQTRVIKEESLLTTLSLGSIYCFLRWKESKAARDLVMAAVLAGLCPFTKVPGAAFVMVLSLLVVREAGFPALMRQLAVSIPTAALWPIFGAIFGWRAYAFTQALQTNRMVHFNIFLRFFDDGMINTFLVGRGWLMFLWLGTLGAVMRRSRDFVVILGAPLIAYLAAIGLGSGDWTYGWYMVPLLPWLCLGAGAFLSDTWEEPDLFRGGIIVFVFLFYTMNFAFAPEFIRSWLYHIQVRWLVTSVLLFGWLPFAIASAFRTRQSRWLARIALVAILGTVTVQSALFVYRWDEFQVLFGNFDRNREYDR
jgi:dolichyl-phosphate-mannose--protein O-mannosyl transferase